jgi:hypothetical protein
MIEIGVEETYLVTIILRYEKPSEKLLRFSWLGDFELERSRICSRKKSSEDTLNPLAALTRIFDRLR